MPITINGLCLTPILADGATVEAEDVRWQEGDKDPPVELRRGDIVMADITGYGLQVKIVRAVPGDVFEVENGRIFINGRKLKNNEGAEYRVNDRAARRFSMYEPIIPPDNYLLLTNIIIGRDDSRRWGLIHRKQIKARIIKEK